MTAVRFFQRVGGDVLLAYLRDVGVVTPAVGAWVVLQQPRPRLQPLHDCSGAEWLQHPLVLAPAVLSAWQAQQLLQRAHAVPAVMSLAAQSAARAAFKAWRATHAAFDPCAHIAPDDTRSFVTRAGQSHIDSAIAPHVHFGRTPRVDARQFNKYACVLSINGAAPSQLARVRTHAVQSFRKQFEEPAEMLQARVFEPRELAWVETRNVLLDGVLHLYCRYKHPKYRALFEQLTAGSAPACVLRCVRAFPEHLAWLSAYDEPCETLHARAGRSRGLLDTEDVEALRACVEDAYRHRLCTHSVSLRDFMWSSAGVAVHPAALKRCNTLNKDETPAEAAARVLLTTDWADYAMTAPSVRMLMSTHR